VQGEIEQVLETRYKTTADDRLWPNQTNERFIMLDIDKARSDTPGVDNQIHFNNAGAALMPRCVIDALKGHIDLEAEIGGYEAADRTLEAQNRAYGAAAEMINCSADQIAIVENATVAWCHAFYGIAETFKPGDRILTAMAEYGSNYISYLQIAKRKGIIIDAIPNDETGQLSLSALENMIDDRVKLITITHVPTNGGLVNPAAGVGKIANAAGIPYLLDACQSVGQLPVDVEEIGCDMLSVTGRKYLRGPRGTGFLYMRPTMLDRFEPLTLDNHAATWTSTDSYEIKADATRFENWEDYIAGKIGLAVSLDYALGWGIENSHKRLMEIADLLRQQLSARKGVVVRDIGAETCGIVTFTVDGIAPAQIKAEMAKRNINVTHSTRFSSRLDMDDRDLDGVVRSSVHYYNTESEVERFMEALDQIMVSH
jgi:cysteine desulfurase / selenocysteine lyase